MANEKAIITIAGMSAHDPEVEGSHRLRSLKS